MCLLMHRSDATPQVQVHQAVACPVLFCAWAMHLSNVLANAQVWAALMHDGLHGAASAWCIFASMAWCGRESTPEAANVHDGILDC